MKVVHLDDFVSGMLWSLGKIPLQSISIAKKNYSTSFFIFLLFSKTFWNRGVGLMTIKTVFLKMRFIFVFWFPCLYEIDFRIEIIYIRRIILRFQFWWYLPLLQRQIRSTIFLIVKILSINQINECKKWNGPFHNIKCIFDFPSLSEVSPFFLTNLDW